MEFTQQTIFKISDLFVTFVDITSSAPRVMELTSTSVSEPHACVFVRPQRLG